MFSKNGDFLDLNHCHCGAEEAALYLSDKKIFILARYKVTLLQSLAKGSDWNLMSPRKVHFPPWKTADFYVCCSPCKDHISNMLSQEIQKSK